MRKLFGMRRRHLGGIAAVCLLGIVAYILATDAYMVAPFRTLQDPLSSQEKVNLQGLHTTHASGGPSPDFRVLKKQLSAVKEPIIVVDTIEDTHGYIGDISTIFLGYQRSSGKDIRYPLRRLIFTGTPKKHLDLMVPEAEVAKKYGFGYKYIKIHTRKDKDVDGFVAFIDTLPENTWLHFHCRGGNGRTSVMLVMLDIMRNAPQVPLADIVKRQHLLGSQDLFDLTPWRNSSYSQKKLQARKDFITQFYDFICQRKAGGIQQWSEWHNRSVGAPHV